MRVIISKSLFTIRISFAEAVMLLALAVTISAALAGSVAFAHSKDDEMARIANPDFQTRGK